MLSFKASAVVLAVWNVASVFVEYSLLVIIYNRVPALATKGGWEGGGVEWSGVGWI